MALAGPDNAEHVRLARCGNIAERRLCRLLAVRLSYPDTWSRGPLFVWRHPSGSSVDQSASKHPSAPRGPRSSCRRSSSAATYSAKSSLAAWLCANLVQVAASALKYTCGGRRTSIRDHLTPRQAELKFGGDALLLLFTGPGHEARACRAAVAMRQELRTAGRLDISGARVQLRMSAGVHTGLFHLFLVGEAHKEFIITGPAASRTVAMEGAAAAGEIVVGDTTAGALRDADLGATKGPGRLLRRAPRWTVASTPTGAPVVPPPDLDLSRSYPRGAAGLPHGRPA